jgi:hypothetical protein
MKLRINKKYIGKRVEVVFLLHGSEIRVCGNLERISALFLVFSSNYKIKLSSVKSIKYDQYAHLYRDLMNTN